MKLSTVPDYVRSYVSKSPSYVILYVTSRCNQRCEFCFYADSLNKPHRDGMTLQEITEIAKSLKNCIHMTLTGGEPFLRRDLVDVTRALITHARVRNITYPTNGSFTERIVQSLETLCTEHPDVEFRIALSIDALGQKHDHIRGMPDAFARAEATFRAVKALQSRFKNLHLIINTVASKYNKNDLKEFLDYASEHLAADDHSLLLARGNTKQPDARDVTPEEFERLVEYLEAKRSRQVRGTGAHSRLLQFVETETRHIAKQTHLENRYQLPCVAGDKFLVIYDTGEVYPCEIIDTLGLPASVTGKFGGSFRLGNVRDFNCDVMKLLQTDRAEQIRQYIVGSKCHCTFECAIAASIVFKPKSLIKTLLAPPSKANRPATVSTNSPVEVGP